MLFISAQRWGKRGGSRALGKDRVSMRTGGTWRGRGGVFLGEGKRRDVGKISGGMWAVGGGGGCSSSRAGKHERGWKKTSEWKSRR